jgi:hypothetical protein
MPAAAASSAPARHAKPLFAFAVPFFAFAAGSLVIGGKTKKKTAFWVVMLFVLALGAVSIGCGGSSGKSSTATSASQSTPAASSYTVTVNASAGSIEHSTSLTVTAN